MRSETKRKIMKLIAARKEFCKKTSEFSRVANKSLDCVEELVSIFNKNNDVTNIVSKIYEENETYAKYFILKKFKNNLYIKVDIYHNKYENMECYNRIELLQYTNDTTKKIMRIIPYLSCRIILHLWHSEHTRAKLFLSYFITVPKNTKANTTNIAKKPAVQQASM